MIIYLHGMKTLMTFLLSMAIGLVTAQSMQILDLFQEKFDIIEYELLGEQDGYSDVYELTIRQDQNHETKEIEAFPQRIWIAHRDFDAPTVLQTSGYSAGFRPNELAELLKANLVIVEYRYYGESIPKDYHWQYLTNDQAADDLHMIRQSLKRLYRKHWVATGISKGGTTTCIYKAKYPRDVRAAVPYVGPLPIQQEDDRMDEHIIRLGEQSCGDKIKAFQKRALAIDDEVLPLIDSIARADQMSFTNVDMALAHEYAVLELPFSFWQYAHACDDIPSADASAREVFNYLQNIVGYNFYSDMVYEFYKPAFYQFFAENGYYRFLSSGFEELLDDADHHSNQAFLPKGVEVKYDPDYMKDVIATLDRKGKRMIYIHGALDPWAACAYRPKPKHDALFIAKEGAGHSVRIADLDQADQDLILEKLKSWLKL